MARAERNRVSKSKSQVWKKGRGKLGPLEPLLGSWEADAETPLGKVRCRRTFRKILGDSCVLLEAEWFLPGKVYREHAIYTAGDGGVLTFWSFTSDGKRSEGKLVDASDVDPAAIAFEAEMPAGTARMVYWPGEDGTVHWAVESKTKKGWKRFSHHRYRAVVA